MADLRIVVGQGDLERLLRYYRSYWLLHDADGTWLTRARRRKIMDDESIEFAAEEFMSANRLKLREVKDA